MTPAAAPVLPPDTVHYRPGVAGRQSRLATFFRWLLLIPHYIVLSVLGLVAGIAVLIAWFAIVLTARYPGGLYRFVAGVMRYAARVNGYAYLLTGAYPPFSGGACPEYPVGLQLGPPKERYSRLLTFFRLVLLIPVYIVAYVLGLVLGVVAFVSWFVILVLGRLPEGLFAPLAFCVSYVNRASVYAVLLTERWPSFEDRPSAAPGDGAGAVDAGG